MHIYHSERGEIEARLTKEPPSYGLSLQAAGMGHGSPFLDRSESLHSLCSQAVPAVVPEAGLTRMTVLKTREGLTACHLESVSVELPPETLPRFK